MAQNLVFLNLDAGRDRNWFHVSALAVKVSFGKFNVSLGHDLAIEVAVHPPPQTQRLLLLLMDFEVEQLRDLMLVHEVPDFIDRWQFVWINRFAFLLRHVELETVALALVSAPVE